MVLMEQQAQTPSLGFASLKLYLPENVNAAMTGPDEKTFRKWSWLVVGLISDIEEELVSAAQ
jgi:hypothetical protein